MSIMSYLFRKIAARRQREIDYILNHSVEVMDEKLTSILKHQQDTVIGRKYGFDTIRNPEEYRERVPLFDYYSLEPLIKKVYENPMGKILTSDPVFWYLQTSGSSGEPKKLPITERGYKDYGTGSTLLWMAYVNQNPDNAKVLDGTMLMFGAAAEMDRINGIPLGYASGVSPRMANPIFKRLLKPGEDVFNIMDMDQKLKIYAEYAVKHDITALIGITTLCLAFVRRMQDEYGPWLVDRLKGTKYEERVRRVMDDDGILDLNELWPNLRQLIAGGIDTDPYRDWMKRTLPNMQFCEVYSSSEGWYASQMFEEPGVQILPNINYLEFIPEHEAEKDAPETIPLSDVKKGHRYEMVLTNLGGYYRYRLGDMMTFTSVNPYTVRHIGRKGRISNLSGEKISDSHVIKSMAAACGKTCAELIDYSVVGQVGQETGQGYYTVAALFRNDEVDVVEFVNAFEDHMKSINEEFRVVREMGGIGPTILRRLRASPVEEKIRMTGSIQVKPIPLTMDAGVLDLCEEAA
ncbi:MAG: GH3 auxin-responsive promoter family protein [Promethearchaeota archaeon]